MNMRKHLIAALAAIVLALPATAGAKTIKIGVVLTFSGGGAQFGQQVERGYSLYMKLHGDQIAPHQVEIIKRDSKRPGGDIAKNAVQELITREKVDLLTGFIYSPNAIASAPLATQGKVPMVIMNAGTSWIPKLSPYIARVSFSMWQAGFVMGKYAAEKLGHKTAITGFTDYPPGKDSAAAFKRGFEDAGGEVVDSIPMGGPREVPDFTPFFQRVKDSKPDAFYVFVPAGNHATAIAKTYDDLAMRAAGVELIGPGDITQDTKLQDMGDAAAGMTVVHHYSADYDNPANQAFVKAWKEAYGADTTPDFMAVAGYDGMAAIFHVIEQLDGDITAETAIKALQGWTYNSPRGPIAIDAATRDIVQNQYVHRIVKEGGRLKVTVIDVVEQVGNPCIELKVGRCGN